MLDALRATKAYENTIVIFSSDHGDMLGAHGGMHEKWHNAYEETIHVPFIVSSPLIHGGRREIDIPTSHADLLPDDARARRDRPGRWRSSTASRPQGGPAAGRTRSFRRRSSAPSRAAPPSPSCSSPTMRSARATSAGMSPFQRIAAGRKIYEIDRPAQPHRDRRSPMSRSDGERHRSSSPATTTTSSSGPSPASATSACAAAETITVTEPEPDEYELYDLTLDPLEQRNLAGRAFADEGTRELQRMMLTLLAEQIQAKRLVPSAGERPGYRPPAA